MPGPKEAHEPRLRDRFSEALTRILRRETVEEDDEETEKESTSKRRRASSGRWRRFFGRLFRTDHDSKETGEHRTFTPLISVERIASDAKDQPNEDNQPPEKEPAAQTGETPFTDQSRTAPELASSDLPMSEEDSIGLPFKEFGVEPPDKQHEVREQPATQEEANEIQTKGSVKDEEELGVLHIHHDSETIQTSAKEDQPAKSSYKTHDRGARGLAIGLTGLEYMGRKRDVRKVNKRIDRQEVQAKSTSQTLENQLNVLKEDNKKIENELQQRNQAAREALKARHIDADIPETQKESTPSRKHDKQEKEPPASQEERQQYVTPVIPETKQAAPANKEKTPELDTKPVPESIQEHTPEAVLASTAEAIERGEPVEKRYELRHELKDDPRAGSPVSVGALLHDRYSATSGNYQPAPSASPQHTSSSSMRSAQTQNAPSMYKQAVVSGFVTAIILAAAAISIVIL